MKISKRQLRRIIKEEKAKLVKEAGHQMGDSHYHSVSSADETELDMASKNIMSILRGMDPMERNPEIYDLIEMLETLASTGR